VKLLPPQFGMDSGWFSELSGSADTALEARRHPGRYRRSRSKTVPANLPLALPPDPRRKAPSADRTAGSSLAPESANQAELPDACSVEFRAESHLKIRIPAMRLETGDRTQLSANPAMSGRLHSGRSGRRGRTSRSLASRAYSRGKENQRSLNRGRSRTT
jgi:hypothetical protein